MNVTEPGQGKEQETEEGADFRFIEAELNQNKTRRKKRTGYTKSISHF